MRDLAQLNATLFATLEALSNEDLAGAELAEEIERSKAISGISNTILSTANLALKAERLAQSEGLIFSASTSKLIGCDD